MLSRSMSTSPRRCSVANAAWTRPPGQACPLGDLRQAQLSRFIGRLPIQVEVGQIGAGVLIVPDQIGQKNIDDMGVDFHRSKLAVCEACGNRCTSKPFTP